MRFVDNCRMPVTEMHKETLPNWKNDVQTEVAEEATRVGADRVDHCWAVEAGAEAEEADAAVVQEAEAFRPTTQAVRATSAANGTQVSRQRTAASSAI